ncbi:MAG: mechanosensitive ion channel [Magnetococcales bacterium]|nr:mechanosensitive ion channel [Magnetococcales bacterium]
MIFSRFLSSIALALILISPLTVLSNESTTTSDSATSPPIWSMKEVTTEAMSSAESAWQKEMSAIPKDALDNTPEGAKRSVYRERLQLLQEIRQIIARLNELKQTQQQLLSDSKNISKELDRLEKMPEPGIIKSVSMNGLAQADQELKNAVGELDRLTQFQKQRQAFLANAANQNQEIVDLIRTANKNHDKFKELHSKESGEKRQLLQLQVENARLTLLVADYQKRLLEEEQLFEKETLNARDQQLQLAILRHRIQEKHYNDYQQAMASQQNVEIQRQETDLEQSLKKLTDVLSEQDRFLASWEANTARIRHRIAKLNKLKTELISSITQEEKRLKAEREELSALQEMIKQSGITENASNELITAFRKLEERKRNADQLNLTTLLQQIDEQKNRLFEINEVLLTLRDTWKNALEEVVTTLPTNQQKAFNKKADERHDQLREQLLIEKRVLMEVESQGRKIQLLPHQRRDIQQEMEAFILSKIFWIKDAESFGLVDIKRLWIEVFSSTKHYSLFNWWSEVLSSETVKQVRDALVRPRFFLMVFFLFILSPIILFHLRKRLTNKNQEAEKQQKNTKEATVQFSRVMVRGALRRSLLPLYIVAAALLINDLTLPAAIGTVIKRTLIHVAIFIWLWRINRFILGFDGILRRYEMVSAEICAVFHWAIRIATLAYLIFLLPWMIFRSTPFNFVSLPRLGYTLFELSVVMIISGLLRRKSPLVKQWIDPPVSDKDKNKALPGFLSRNWTWISLVGFAYMLSIIVLDVMGYRFGAGYLARNTLLTIGTIGLLSIVNHAVLVLINQIVGRKRRIKTSSGPGQQRYETRALYLDRMRRTIRLVSIFLGIWFLSGYWGINESVFQVLQDYSLYSTTGPDGKLTFVTLADLFKFFATLTFVFWLVKHLPKIFDIVYYSRSNMEMGMRYAVVTMSRYLVFFIGLFTAFSFLKLNLTQIGWLVAAMSVGLGFGLQEIVANFVSGIILLVERPIRLGDTIILGVEMGKVTKINIRSTTIQTPDNHELMIPNKSLITQEVKNWTLQDTKTRLVIMIGVAYGTDVDLVTETLLKIADEQPEILKDPKPQALLMLHGINSLDYEFRVFLSEISHRAPLTDRLNKLINKRFKELGIEIPFPQQDVHLRSISPEILANGKFTRTGSDPATEQ